MGEDVKRVKDVKKPLIALAVALAAFAMPAPAGSAASGLNQFVGIEYWLESKAGLRLTEHTIAPGVRYTLHIKSNSAGFLGVWTTSNGERVTPDYEGFSGHRLEAHTVYVAPGDFRKSSSPSDGSVVVLFSRSQTEQVRTAEQALQKLNRLGPALFSEPGAKGSTFIYHRDGAQPAVQISITR
jgi:hypothetical protein